MNFRLPPSFRSLLLVTCCTTAFAITRPALKAETSTSHQPLQLWYESPAANWNEALPVGNGRLSAMIFGGAIQERLQLNEGTLWAGGPYDPVNPQAKAALPEVRQLVNEGKYRAAAQLISAKVMAKPLGQMPYQTVGDLMLNFAGATNLTDYRRELDLETATATVSYTSAGVRYTREIFATAPDNVIVVRLTADRKGALSFTAGLKTPMKATVEAEDNDTLVLRGLGGDAGGIKGQLNYEARVKIITAGGFVSLLGATSPAGLLPGQGHHLNVNQADSVTILITAATSYKKFDDITGDPTASTKKQLAAAAKKSVAKLRAAHLKDYQTLFRRVTLDLGSSDATQLPTNVRIQKFAAGHDPQLAALYYQFGRYLLISCSRPGGFEVELTWQNGTLTGATVKSVGGRKATLRYGDRTTEIELKPGKLVRLNAALTPAAKS